MVLILRQCLKTQLEALEVSLLQLLLTQASGQPYPHT